MTTEIYAHIELLWKYLSVGELVEPCDIAFVLGRDDFSIPKRMVSVYNNGLAPVIIILGGRGRLTGSIEGSESQEFKKQLLAQGIPEEVILIEEKSTNTGENIIEGLKVIKENSLQPKRICLITHRPHTRRALAVASALNSSITWLPCPDECTVPGFTSDRLIEVAKELVGEVLRLEEYPKLGYFENQHIPQEIISAKSAIEEWLK